MSLKLHKYITGYFGLCVFQPQLFACWTNTALFVDIDGEVGNGKAVFVVLLLLGY